MDKYNHWLAKLVRVLNPSWTQCAITLGQTTYYSCYRDEVDAAWRAHEDTHKKQFKRDGWVKFFVLYLWWTMWHGYDFNPYEVEAEQARAAAARSIHA